MRSNCTEAETMDMEDLHSKSLRRICDAMSVCKIKRSTVHGMGLFNASDHHIEEGTVFQVLSYGELIHDKPVLLQCIY